MSSSLMGVNLVTNSLLDMSSFSIRPSSTWKAVGFGYFYFFLFNNAATILLDWCW